MESRKRGGPIVSEKPLLQEDAALRLENGVLLEGGTELLRAIYEGALDAFMLVDDEGRYVDANPSACRLFGLTRSELVGRSILDFAVADAAITEAGFRDFRARGQMTGTFHIRRPDGSERSLG